MDKHNVFYTTDIMRIPYYHMHDFPIAFIKYHGETLSSYQTFFDDSMTTYMRYTHSFHASS